ncbi:putative dienelactone hydrolase [Luteitalea pratensis]|uniref:Putative dienelactone hydrolase n=1 Tax=Luteitalea pratensis TaxID=1855912 RepID=A0A143PUP3_LUTPR|nr:alpha/beta hydrolase family protein [Luteitalea pratensis]AMY12101.1 putative dienelactone hydrolase [Luteitalea pratensis]
MSASSSSRSHRVNRRRFLQAAAIASTTPMAAGSTRARAADTTQQATAAARAVAPSGSDVGSLFPFIQKQAVQGPFPMSFTNPQFRSLEDWTATARATVLDLLHYAPPPCDPRAETFERVDCGDYIREKVFFNTTPDLRVPAYVLAPKRATAARPAPAIVALHDHGGFYLWGKEKLVSVDGEHPVFTEFRQRYYGGRSIAIDLARRGYVVVVIDMFYWGDRRMLLDDDPADWRDRPSTMAPERVQAFNTRASQNEQLVGRTLYTAGITWPGVMFWDDIRTVDYLLTRPDVDSKRIGCVGLSVGAVRSAHLAALDDRIKAGVVVCWMTSFPGQLKKHIRNTIGHTKVVPGLHRHLDYPDVASLAMPRPVLFMSGSQDGLFDLDAVKASFATLNACYAKAGMPDRCRTRMYDSPHQFNAEMQAEAWAWLERFV